MSIRQETILDILSRNPQGMTAQEIGEEMVKLGMTGPTSSNAKVGQALRILQRYGKVRPAGERKWRNGATIIVWEAVE